MINILAHKFKLRKKLIPEFLTFNESWDLVDDCLDMFDWLPFKFGKNIQNIISEEAKRKIND